MQVAVGEDDEAAVLGTGVLAGLLFGDERILVLGLGVKEEEVDEPFFDLLDVVAERVQVG